MPTFEMYNPHDFMNLGDHLRSCSEAFRANDKYALIDKVMNRAFRQFPENSVPEHVLLKVSLVNSLYSTAIYDIHKMASHILTRKIDDKIKQGDPTVIQDLQVGHGIGGRKERNFYVFATKYAHWHSPTVYPMCDSKVTKALIRLNRAYSFSPDLKRSMPNDYAHYAQLKALLDLLIERTQLPDSYKYKQIDEALWFSQKTFEDG